MIYLRPVTMADADFLYRCRTDPLTRAMSLTDGPPNRDAHLKWLTLALRRDTAAVLYLAELGGVAVGTCRLDPQENGQALVSLTVAPEHRGKGYAATILLALVEEAKRQGYRALRAEIKTENAPSLRAFLAAGFRLADERVEMVLRLLP